jgi:hypothetical protein
VSASGAQKLTVAQLKHELQGWIRAARRSVLGECGCCPRRQFYVIKSGKAIPTADTIPSALEFGALAISIALLGEAYE